MFFEKLDFKNTNTEKAEKLLLSKLKNIVEKFKSRNFEQAQILREVIIRHHFKAETLQPGQKEDLEEHNDRISKIFLNHKFEELDIIINDSNYWENYGMCYSPQLDVDALLETLTKCGYSQEKGDWDYDEREDKYTFFTLFGTKEYFENIDC